jgi:hypothetical protein
MKKIKIDDNMRILLGREAKIFSESGAYGKGRTKHETIKNRFSGNCRHFICAQTLGVCWEPVEKEQGWTLKHKGKKVLVKPFYNSIKNENDSNLSLIGDPTHYLTNPEFDLIALVCFNERESEGWLKAIIPKKEYLKNFKIDKYGWAEKIWLNKNVIKEYEYQEESNEKH